MTVAQFSPRSRRFEVRAQVEAGRNLSQLLDEPGGVSAGSNNPMTA